MLEFLIAFAAFYLWHGMGITVGYHRLLAHRSFQCKKPFEYFWVLGGYGAYQGSPIWWSAIHRAHHRYSDGPLDPHSPRQGVKHALFGWLLEGKYPAHIDPDKQCKDLNKDPLYRFLECGGRPDMASLLNFVINVAFRAALWWLFGWKIAVASIAASVMVFQVPQMLNVICHLPRYGYKNFGTHDDGVNVWWVGLLGMGEGWHNNHHAFPNSAKTGLRWFEFDLSWLTIKLGKALGLVTAITVPPAMQTRLAQRKAVMGRLRNFRRLRAARLAA